MNKLLNISEELTSAFGGLREVKLADLVTNEVFNIHNIAIALKENRNGATDKFKEFANSYISKVANTISKLNNYIDSQDSKDLEVKYAKNITKLFYAFREDINDLGRLVNSSDPSIEDLEFKINALIQTKKNLNQFFEDDESLEKITDKKIKKFLQELHEDGASFLEKIDSFLEENEISGDILNPDTVTSELGDWAFRLELKMDGLEYDIRPFKSMTTVRDDEEEYENMKFFLRKLKKEEKSDGYSNYLAYKQSLQNYANIADSIYQTVKNILNEEIFLEDDIEYLSSIRDEIRKHFENMISNVSAVDNDKLIRRLIKKNNKLVAELDEVDAILEQATLPPEEAQSPYKFRVGRN